MSAPRSGATAVRGALAGACSGAVVVAAHGLGGGAAPAGDTLVLLALAGAAVGAGVRTLPTAPLQRLAAMAAVLGAGQLAGHLALTVTADHVHGFGVTPGMVSAHVVAALVCAALIGLAELGADRAVSALRRLVAVLCAIISPDPERRTRHRFARPAATLPLLLSSATGTRGPPALLLLA
ncbi:hypothetical protein [Aldersonia kunmingensis]|uniref:hypothetical protein n=1 Tax=Aldersonia kunmingensis TaxID=408066 RepID=UPI000829782B|nr:hypothetical protein [Aldersonia kunmingensis]